jgi:hypothetical protein
VSQFIGLTDLRRAAVFPGSAAIAWRAHRARRASTRRAGNFESKSFHADIISSGFTPMHADGDEVNDLPRYAIGSELTVYLPWTKAYEPRRTVGVFCVNPLLSA